MGRTCGEFWVNWLQKRCLEPINTEKIKVYLLRKENMVQISFPEPVFSILYAFKYNLYLIISLILKDMEGKRENGRQV